MKAVYMMYLDGELYAYTDSSLYKKRFKKERIKKFKYKTARMTRNTLKRYEKDPHIYLHKLHEYPFKIKSDKWLEVNVLCTHEEYDTCIDESYKMDDKLGGIYKRLILQGGFGEKDRNAIEYLVNGTSTLYHRQPDENAAEVLSNENLLNIFLDKYHHLFKTWR